MGKTPNPMDFNSVRRGLMLTQKHSDIVPFKMLGGRDDKLYERKHGLPRVTKKEAEAEKSRFSKKVDCLEFLPNSIMKTPKKSIHSNTFKTQSLGLYKVKGGWGKQAKTLLGSFDPQLSVQDKPQYWSSHGPRARKALSEIPAGVIASERAIEEPASPIKTEGAAFSSNISTRAEDLEVILKVGGPRPLSIMQESVT